MQPKEEPATLEEAASMILGEVPAQSGPAHPIEFHPIVPIEAAPRCAAVDGGSTVVLDVRSAGLYYVRSGYSIREPDDHFLDRQTCRNARTITRRSRADAWSKVRKSYAWGVDVDAPLLDATRLVPQMAEAERILTEYDACRRALHELRRGDLLLLDGSMDDEERYALLRRSLLDRAAEVGVTVAGLSKDSSLSIGGVLPMTLELEEWSIQRGLQAPWWVDVTDALGRRESEYRILGVRFDSRSPAYRVDAAAADAARVAAILSHFCNDAAYPGYPYLLARVHQRVHYEPGESLDLRRDLEGIVARRRGHRLSLRLFSKGRDVLELAN